jgi:hemerythrin-like domain-containing protein
MAREFEPLRIIDAERKNQRWFCEYLEQIADRLPAPISKSDINEIYSILRHKLPAYHRNEEALFFLITENNRSDGILANALAMFLQEHQNQQCFADEFEELFISSSSGYSLDSCGYLLRYFFETIAVHLDWEDVIMMPHANDLGKADLARLAAKISLHSAGFLPQQTL